MPARNLLALTQRLLAVTRDRRCPLLVHDRVDVAVAAGADGVHLPENGLDVGQARRLAARSDFLVGVSTHSARAGAGASRDGADLVVFGPVFATPSQRPPLGVDALRQAAAAVRGAGPTILYAIGGFGDVAAVSAAREAGAHGVAAMRAFVGEAGPD